MVKAEIKYSFWIGIQKSVKNVIITVGIPALVVLINNYADWLPKEWYGVGVPLIAMVGYLVKNKVSFKG